LEDACGCQKGRLEPVVTEKSQDRLSRCDLSKRFYIDAGDLARERGNEFATLQIVSGEFELPLGLVALRTGT
jgi:hypothetical protein